MRRAPGHSDCCQASRPPYAGRMFAAAAGETVWHYWLGVALAIPAVGLVFATIIGYVRKVVMPRYPRR